MRLWLISFAPTVTPPFHCETRELRFCGRLASFCVAFVWTTKSYTIRN